MIEEVTGSSPPIGPRLELLSQISHFMALAVDYRHGLSETGRLVVRHFTAGFAVDLVDAESGKPVEIFNLGNWDGARTFEFGLAAGGRMVGTMRVGRSSPLSDEERFVLAEIALRIAIAISSAQLYEQAAHVADTLQRALLPDRLPSKRGLAFHAAYLPGAREAIVGGDFYDAFHLPDGRVAFAIGDVAGHGLLAAVVMGEVRQALRAAAIGASSPSAVLERANTILNMRANPTMVTAIFGIFDSTEASFTYATAGHPPPLICLDDHIYELPTRGVALGITDAVDAQDWVFPLPPGALLVLYTDGTIEYDRDLARGEETLRALIRKVAVLKARDPANEVIHRLFHKRENSDDAAVLTLSAAPEMDAHLTLTFSAIELALPIARNALRRYAEALALGPDDTCALLTSVGEAMANGVLHAYEPGQHGIVRLQLAVEDTRLTATIEDWGRWRRAPSREHGGRGLRIMRSLMDRVEIQSEQRHTVVRLVKNLER